MQHPQREWRAALLALVALIAVLVLPLAVRGEVVYPDDGRAQLGLETRVEAANVGARRLGDASNYYVPEEHHHLHGDASGWISVWNPHVQLGRPSSHLAGVSPAYPPARVLAWFAADAYWFHTILSLATIAGTAAAMFLFLRAIGLGPWACCAGAAGLGLGSFATYWATFPIFVAGLGWTAAILWLVTRWLQRPGFAVGMGLAFSTYALLLSAYPQQIVWHAWIVAGYAVARWWRSPRRGAAAIAGLAMCAALGLLAAAPVYADLALQAARSARVDVDREFFLASLPRVEGARDVVRLLASMVDAFLAGDPYETARERDFNGVCLAPAFAGFVGLAFATEARRRAAGWLAFAGLALVLTVWPAGYLFGVDHLGLSISRFRPQAAALIPLAVAGALGVDALLRGRAVRPLGPLALALSPLVLAACCARPDAGASRWLDFGAVGAGLAALVLFRWRALVPALALASLLGWSAPLLVTVPRAAIAGGSPLVDLVRARTADGSRFALAGARSLEVLPPNQEALHGLRSVHSYDSLSSRAYRDWGAAVSEARPDARAGWLRVHARWFQSIAGSAGFAGPSFSQAGVGLVLARETIATDALVPDGALGPWRIHRPARPPVLQAHVLDLDPAQLDAADLALGGHVQDHDAGALEVLEDRDDLRRIRLEPRDRVTLLFLSVQAHPHWTASARLPTGAVAARTVVVDGLYLGVVVPAGCEEVEVRFRPWTRWAWIPQAAFALGAAWILARAARPARPSALAA